MFDSTTFMILIMLVLLLYLLPTLIAYGREHLHRQDVAIVNIVFGWTLIGWILVFLWAALGRVEQEPA
ncbi:MAG TPA: superinfection immunity protein [Stellaceae bacterium]|nr:superinfection immunity protein [Stellaceae bacterium]